jgi:hypothetical protein
MGQLRHLYVQLVEGLVTQQAEAATHLLSPAIEALELADRAEAAPAAAQLRAGTWHGKTCVSAPFCECADREIERLTRERDEARAAAQSPREELERDLPDEPVAGSVGLACRLLRLHDYPVAARVLETAFAAPPAAAAQPPPDLARRVEVLTRKWHAAQEAMIGAGDSDPGIIMTLRSCIHDLRDLLARCPHGCGAIPGTPGPHHLNDCASFVRAALAGAAQPQAEGAPDPETKP